MRITELESRESRAAEETVELNSSDSSSNPLKSILLGDGANCSRLDDMIMGK